jgi:hypothetical protein
MRQRITSGREQRAALFDAAAAARAETRRSHAMRPIVLYLAEQSIAVHLLEQHGDAARGAGDDALARRCVRVALFIRGCRH